MTFPLNVRQAVSLLPALFLLLTLCSGRDSSLKKNVEIAQYTAMYESDDWTSRRSAVMKISRYDAPESAELLIRATHDSHSLVVIDALKGIRRHTSPAALARVKELAREAEDPNIRWHALRTLGAYKDPSSSLIFVKELKNPDWLLREEAVRGLLKIDDNAIQYLSVPYILQALDDESTSVKIMALRNLRIKDERINIKLSEMLFSTGASQHLFIDSILKALIGYKLEGATREKVITFLTHQNMEIRLSAHRVLVADEKISDVPKKPSSRKRARKK